MALIDEVLKRRPLLRKALGIKPKVQRLDPNRPKPEEVERL